MNREEMEWAIDMAFSQSLMFGRAQEIPLSDVEDWRNEEWQEEEAA